MDSNRPVHLDNIFDQTNVRILANSNEISSWNLPNRSQIFEDEEEDENDEDKSSNEENEHEMDLDRRIGIAERIERRTIKAKQKENWKRTRKAILWDYYMSSWHATSVIYYFFS